MTLGFVFLSPSLAIEERSNVPPHTTTTKEKQVTLEVEDNVTTKEKSHDE
jgi:hypothetical protein